MKLKTLLKELHTDESKVVLVKIKHQAARAQILGAKILMDDAQSLLDKATSNYVRKVKTHKILDIILAEFKLEIQRELAVKNIKSRTGKSAKQTLADVMECLKALPDAQRVAVIKAMEDKQRKGDHNDNY